MTALTPPSDRDAEYRLVWAVAAEPELHTHAGQVRADHFHNRAAAAAWGKLAEAARAERPVILADFQEFYQPDLVLLPAFVAEDARRVLTAWACRAGLAKMGEAARAAYAGQPDEMARLLGEGADLQHGHTADTLVSARTVANETWDELVNWEALQAALVPTGLTPLDRALGGGLERGTSTVIMARPAMGKTALLCQIADAATSLGMRVAFFSKEMTRKQILRRMALRRARVSWLDFKQGKVAPIDRERVMHWVEQFAARATLYFDDSTPQTSAEVMGLCDGLKRRLGGVDLVLADHLRLFNDAAEKEVKRLGIISWNFKQIAKRLDCAAICAAQLSRAVEGQSDRRPDLKDLRDSGEIEENADGVIALYRDSYYTDSADKTAELILRKARDGVRNDAVKMVFVGEYMSFEMLQGTSNGTHPNGAAARVAADALI